MSYHYLLKYIVVGDSGIGKSCLLLRFIDDRFQQCHDVTIGVEFGTKIIDDESNDQKIKLQIWDTAGQENFKSITRSYYRGSAGCLLCYDITKKESFENAKTWLEDARKYASKSLVVMLVGNKSDLNGLREVSTEEARQFADTNELLFLETSAKTGDNVKEAFYNTAKEISQRINSGEIQPEFGSDEMGSGVRVGSLLSIGNREKEEVKVEEKDSKCKC